MEELAEGFIKTILRLIGVVIRGLAWVIWGLCFWELGWYIGWPIWRAISFGYYPKGKITDQNYVNTFSGFIVSLTGIVALISLAAVIAKLVGSG